VPSASEIVAGLAAVKGLGNDTLRLRSSTTATAIGIGLIAFGWLYPHFLQSQPMFMYVLAAPMGLIPCPTLAVLMGFTVLHSGFSRGWSIAVAAFGLFYGVFGALRLDVWLDVGLLAGALYLLTTIVFESHVAPQRALRVTQ
jgi:hypothetical protein